MEQIGRTTVIHCQCGNPLDIFKVVFKDEIIYEAICSDCPEEGVIKEIKEEELSKYL